MSVDEFVVFGVPDPFKKIVYPLAFASPAVHVIVNVTPLIAVDPDVIEGDVKQYIVDDAVDVVDVEYIALAVTVTV